MIERQFGKQKKLTEVREKYLYIFGLFLNVNTNGKKQFLLFFINTS